MQHQERARAHTCGPAVNRRRGWLAVFLTASLAPACSGSGASAGAGGSGSGTSAASSSGGAGTSSGAASGTGSTSGTASSGASGGTGSSSSGASGGTGSSSSGASGGTGSSAGSAASGSLGGSGASSGSGSGLGGSTSGIPEDGGTANDASSASTEAGAGCPGVPLVPDDGGSIAVGSNSVGIHGSWFVYSDCTDLKGVNCAMVTAPSTTNSFPNVGGKMCTSGTTSTANGAWGAGIAFELNDGPPQMPYDTTAHGVLGFCFVLTGPTIPSTTIRVAFPTQDNNDNAYFEAVSTAGTHSVLFSDTAQGSWVTATSAFEPTKVTLVQFQIPSSTTAPVPWDFCVEGVTAITE
jgi:hypothetical protein